MSQRVASPGPIAEDTFDVGFRIAVIGGLVGVGLLYLFGPLSLTPTHVLFTLLLFPVYLVFVALVMGVWLGYETDRTDLTPVTEEVEMEADPWKNWPW